jgi:nitroimidazol reductase NimA-like FMN-containing flavoprotein (pyridoxamine 5'-phosphate oxidase superfamily)
MNNGRPPVDDGPTDRRGLRVLDLDDCLTRMGAGTVGRVAFAADGDLTILPVTYLVDGIGVSFLTTWGSKLQVAADRGRMAFEVDETDTENRTGWSVLLQGTAAIVDDPSRVRALDARLGEPWVPTSNRGHWVHLRPDSVSGREIRRAGQDVDPAVAEAESPQ